MTANALAAIDRHAPAVGMRRQFASFLVDLYDEFARRREHQTVRARRRFVRPPGVQEWKQKRGRLSGAGLRLADDIAARERMRDQCSLNRRRLDVRGAIKSVEKGGLERQGTEAASRFRQNRHGQILLPEAVPRLPRRHKRKVRRELYLGQRNVSSSRRLKPHFADSKCHSFILECEFQLFEHLSHRLITVFRGFGQHLEHHAGEPLRNC